MAKEKYTMAEYEMLWRPNFEVNQTIIWLVASVVSLGVHFFTPMDTSVFLYFTATCLLMAFVRGYPAAVNAIRLKSLSKVVLSFISPPEHKKKISKFPNALWLGWGFDWESKHTQRAFDLQKVNPRSFVGIDEDQMGAPWLHSVARGENDLTVPLEHLEGHSLIVGTTGSGKTRLLDLICSAAVRRAPKECLIVVDPKGDRDLREGLRKACVEMGEPDRFMLFHPAFPEESCRINPLQNFTRTTEIGSRISACLGEDTGSDTFINFGQMAITHIVGGLVQSRRKPTLRDIRRVIEVGPDKLVCDAIEVYLREIHEERWIRPVSEKEAGYKKSRDPERARADALINYYRNCVDETSQNPDLEGLMSLYEHDRVHFSKMITSLMPVLTMLTSGPLGELLSPRGGEDDERLIANTASLITEGKVLYIGLDSLSDNAVAKMVGSMLLADMASVAGDRYNYMEKKGTVVNLIVDEAAEVVNKPTIQLLNKGRGAQFRMTIATQTFQDFTAALGSQANAEQVLANCNNLIALRTMDAETQNYITDSIPTTRIRYIMQTQAASTDSEDPILFSGNHGERLMEEEVPLFSPQWLGMLPNLHYLGKVSGGRIIKGRLPILQHEMSK